MAVDRLRTSVLIILSGILATTQARCRCEHEIHLKHYEELGCKPVFAKDEDCCPSYYDCEEKLIKDIKDETLEESLERLSRCHFKGQVFKSGEKLDNEQITGTCRTDCVCLAGRFQCGHIDCPEFLGHSILEPGCKRKYKPNSCCSSGAICEPFDNLPTCKVGDKTYLEGERFYSEEEPCMSCACDKGFNGTIGEPFCNPVLCDLQPKFDKLNNFCAPVYYGDKRCCPIEWKCNEPHVNTTGKNSSVSESTEATTNVETTTEKLNTDKTKNCLFGSKPLALGEKFELDEEVSCKCSTPPLVTCIQRPSPSR